MCYHTPSEDAVTPAVWVLTGAISICSVGCDTCTAGKCSESVTAPALQMLTARALWM